MMLKYTKEVEEYSKEKQNFRWKSIVFMCKKIIISIEYIKKFNNTKTFCKYCTAMNLKIANKIK